MHVLDRDTFRNITNILSSKYYEKWCKYYKTVLRGSRLRNNINNPKRVLAIQYGLAAIETKIIKLLRQGRHKAKLLHNKGSPRTENEEKELDGLEKHILIHEQLIRINKTIADGLAWRCLKFNRMFLLSAARGFGKHIVDLDSKSSRSELKWAYIIQDCLKSTVLINDLTHFLKIGDLTEINKDGIFIHDIKEYGKKVKNMFTLKKGRITSQDARLLELQRLSLLNEVKIEGKITGQRVLDVEIRTYIPVIKKLIRKSEKEGIVFKTISDCITVEVVNYKSIYKFHNNFDYIKSKFYEIPKTSKSIIHSNYDSYYSDPLGNFLRASPPYSIYPFNSSDCIDLISGQLLIKSILDIDLLKKYLKTKNWEIEDTSEAELDEALKQNENTKQDMFTVNKRLYEQPISDVGIFKIKRGAFHTALDTNLYSRLTMEYMTLESLNNILEAMYMEAAKAQTSEAYFPIFNSESKIWR